MTYCHRRAPGGYRKYLTALANEQRAIVDAVNALRRRYTYVFITGGIGSTHLSYTADCVAKGTAIRARHPA